VIVVTPAEMPVTTPIELIEPVDGALLLHVPPLVASFKLVVPPTFAQAVPVIAAGDAFTVTTVVITAPHGVV